MPLRVSGRIPDWLDGVLLKNGPGTFKDKQVRSRRTSASFLVLTLAITRPLPGF